MVICIYSDYIQNNNNHYYVGVNIAHACVPLLNNSNAPPKFQLDSKFHAVIIHRVRSECWPGQALHHIDIIMNIESSCSRIIMLWYN